jgi:virginiamycin A acetyltransferase
MQLKGDVMRLIKKVLFRIFRMATGKKGVYGKIHGKGNKFTKGVFITEGASIGKYNYFGPYTMINNARVENYCSIGPGVKIGQGNHSLSYITTYQKISSKLIGHSLSTTPSMIGNDVWCGANVVIMQGVKVGNGAVIGANAVVTHDVPDYGIALGIPAKIIRYRFDDEIIKAIKESRWYDYDINEAKDVIRRLEKLINSKENSRIK